METNLGMLLADRRRGDCHLLAVAHGRSEVAFWDDPGPYWETWPTDK